MFAVKLLAKSAVVCNCYIVLKMPSFFTFHIPLAVLYCNWSQLKAVNNVLISYINDNLPRKMLNIKHFSLRFAIQNAIKV